MEMIFNPYPYQRRAIDWVLDHPRCGLFMEMGLGKTVVTLTAASALLQAGAIEKVLVVAPLTVAESTWQNEVRKWPHLRWLRCSTLLGTPKQRTKALHADAEIYIISRDLLVWLLKECGGHYPFDMVVLDELTSFKNPSAQRFKAIKAGTMATRRVVGLTGTPSPNGMKDLWAQVFCLDRGKRLGRFSTHFRRRWFNVIEHNHIPIRITPRPGAEQEIMDLLEDLCLAMRTEDYLTLPPLIERDEPITLPGAVMERYRRFEREQVLEFDATHQDGGGALVAAGAAVLLGKLTQYAGGAVYREDGTAVLQIHDRKTARLVELVESLGEPVLCFYQYRHEADRIEQALAKVKGLRVARYHDSSQMEAWNGGQIDVLLAHPSSTAFGLNLQAGGSVVCWYAPTWNLEQYQQANARLHRQGQSKPVRVFRLVATGTVDERIAASLSGKATEQATVMKILSDTRRNIGESGAES